MKRIIICLIAIAFTHPMFSQTLNAGYRGFGDLGYATYSEGGTLNGSAIEITTTHGYQINPHLFVGAGIGFIFTGECKYGDVSGHPYLKRDSKTDMPLFFDFNANILKKSLTPFFDVKVGACVNDEFNTYANLSVGCRYAINDKTGVSLKIGISSRKLSSDELNIISGTAANNYKSTFVYRSTEGNTVNGLYFGIGFDL